MYKVVNTAVRETEQDIQRAEEEELQSSTAVVMVVSHYVIQMRSMTV